MLRYNVRSGVRKIKTKTALAISVFGLGAAGFVSSMIIMGAAHAAPSSNYILFGDAAIVSGGNPGSAVQATSSSGGAGYGGVNFNDPSGLTVGQLTNLSTDYRMTAGDCGGGAPRFSVGVTDGTHTGNIFVYLGPAPSYTGCATTWTNTGNLVASSSLVDTSQLPGGTFYDTYSNAQANYSSYTITDISLVVDAYWSAISNDPQTVQIDNTAINTTTYGFEPPTVTVTIDKYVDGSQATSVDTNNASFPMVSTWSASNIGSGTGNYSLSPSGFNNPNPYYATTSDMTVGASYTTNEVLGTNVSAICSINGGGYALVGYTTGDTLALAAAATPTPTIPAFTNLQTNKFVIVWNKSCTKLTNSDQCKNDGWKSYGSTFKNQGDCVSYVATQGKNQPSGPAKH